MTGCDTRHVGSLPLCRLFVVFVADETHHRCVIYELEDAVRVVLGTTVMSHQGQRQRAQNTSLGDPIVHEDGLRDVAQWGVDAEWTKFS